MPACDPVVLTALHVHCAHVARVRGRVHVWICAWLKEQQGRLKKAILEYVILVGSSFSGALSDFVAARRSCVGVRFFSYFGVFER